MVIKGYVNIQRLEHAGRVSYYTGSDIHADIDSAKRVANKNTVLQIYIAFDTEDMTVHRRERDMTEYYAKKELAEERVQIRAGEKSKRRSRKTEG